MVYLGKRGNFLKQRRGKTETIKKYERSESCGVEYKEHRRKEFHKFRDKIQMLVNRVNLYIDQYSYQLFSDRL